MSGGARKIQPPKDEKSPMAFRPPGWLGVGDMLPITGRTNSRAQIILGLEQSDFDAS
jgi:hypothetical protein